MFCIQNNVLYTEPDGSAETLPKCQMKKAEQQQICFWHRAVESFKGFQQMSFFSDALKKTNAKMQNSKCKNLPFLVFKFQEQCVKLNFESKKCLNINFS